MGLEDQSSSIFVHNLLSSFAQERNKKQNPERIYTPFRKIACKNIADDFYCNLIDWSGNHIYYSVSDSVFVYDFHSERTDVLFHSPNNAITALRHCSTNNTLCIGTASGLLNFIDLYSLKHSKYLHHRGRIGTMEICSGSIITGSRDRHSKIIDLRAKRAVNTISTHLQEVCGVSINSCEKYLATGGNDNKIFVHDMRNLAKPLFGLNEHLAAVRALSWSPYSSTQFVSGGGSADKTIKHWNISSTSPLIGSYNFESQICNLKWLKTNRILSTYGYSNDDIKLLEGFRPVKVFTGHKNRVIHFAVDPFEKYFVSGSSDSKIRVWEIDDMSNNEIKFR